MACQNICSDSSCDCCLRAEPIFRRFVKQRKRADDDRLQFRGFAIVGHIDALAGPLILLGAASECKALDMDESARHLQAMTTARMYAHATVFVLNANPRSGISRLFALVAEAIADSGDRLRN